MVFLQVDMAWSSMNHGDVFVLDSGKRISFSIFSRKIFFDFIFTFLPSGKKIFVWKGSGASGQEKMTAGLIAAK